MDLDISTMLKDFGTSSRRRDSLNISAIPMQPIIERSKRVEMRYIPTTPYKILDAPGIIDDYYLNLLDWNSNLIGISLKDTVYSFNTDSGDVAEVYNCNQDSHAQSDGSAYVSCVKGQDDRLAIGDSTGALKIFDFASGRLIENRKLHDKRICAMSFNDRILSSGGKDGKICNIDFRMNHPTVFVGHTEEICGMKWSPTNEYLASGSNDNSVKIWKLGYPMCRTLKGHSSAVKAMDWCSWKSNTLCTGGGSKDRTIRFWDVFNPAPLKTIETSSQICTIHFLSNYRELVTSHGFQENSLKLWKCSSMSLLKDFGTHEARVLHTAVSPDQVTVVSLGADESLKFWKIGEKRSEGCKRPSINVR